MSLDGTEYFPFCDGNGNITEYMDENGTTVAHREYDPFGGTVVSTGDKKNDFEYWFSTKYTDEETGLLYFGFRYLNPGLGRWLSRDPAQEYGTQSMYLFVRNNSLLAYDLLGLWGEDVHQRDTADWATWVGFPGEAALAIGKADNAVDGWGTGPLPIPIAGDQSYHFNRSFGGRDTRLVHSEEHKRTAEKLCDWRLGNDEADRAVQYIGLSLHPLQDWVAHGEYAIHNAGGVWTVHNKGGVVSPSGSGHDVTDYPDVWHLDAVGGYRGRPAGRGITFGSTWPTSNGIAVYQFGTQRWLWTQELTIRKVSEIRSYIDQHCQPCGECYKKLIRR